MKSLFSNKQEFLGRLYMNHDVNEIPWVQVTERNAHVYIAKKVFCTILNTLQMPL